MRLVGELNFNGIVSDSTVLWSRGNAPTQEAESLGPNVLRLHFISAYLLSDRLVASASYFYESARTRELTREFADIFRRGDAVYFVDENLDGFQHHALRKKEKSPVALGSYHNEILVASASAELNALNYIVRRSDKSVSEGIVRLWSADLLSSNEGTLGWALTRVVKDAERARSIMFNLFRRIEMRGERDFVWEFVHPALLQEHLPQDFLRFAKHRLAQFYSVATAALLGIPVDSSEHASARGLGVHSRFDTALFLECMEAMNLIKHLIDLDVAATVRLKASVEFQVFREFYFALIDAATYNSAELIKLLPIYTRLEANERLFTSDRDTVVRAFLFWFRSLKGNSEKYEVALHKLLIAYDAFGSHVVRDLSALVLVLAKPNLRDDLREIGGVVLDPKALQSVVGSNAGRDIVQNFHIYQLDKDATEKTAMKTLPKEQAGHAPTKEVTPSQVIADTRVGGEITQITEATIDSQEVRRVEVAGDISQRKAAASEMSFAWGTARGYGVIGLVLAFLGWLVYRYLLSQ